MPGVDLGVRRAALAVALLAMVFLFSLGRSQTSGSKTINAPATQFSAVRAFEVLKRLVGDDIPHPLGSPANQAVRNRAISELKNLGYAPEVADRLCLQPVRLVRHC